MPGEWTPERRQAARERLLALKPWEKVKNFPKKGVRRSQIQRSIEKDGEFLLAFYGEDSPTKGNKQASALAVGYSETTALDQSTRIFRQYDKKRFQEALKACGVNNLLMGWRLRKMIEEGADKDAINAIRLALAAKGEATDQQAGTTINNSGPVMVIVGASSKRIEDLRKAVPQLSKEQEEEIENARCQARLDELKAMNRPRRILEEKPLPGVSEADAPGNLETESDAG